MLHVFRVAWHDHFHKVFGVAVSALTLNQYFFDIAIIEIADRTFDQIALFIDFGRRDGFQRQFADLFPKTLQVFVIAFDFGLGTLCARSAHNQTRALGHIDAICDFFDLFTIHCVGNLATNTTTARGVRHQNTIATRQR